MTEMHAAQDEPRSIDQQRRRRWMGLFARAPLPLLERMWNGLGDKPAYDYLRRPEAGLAMVRGRVCGSGGPFNLGEITLSRCVVRLEDGTVGYGYTSDRNPRHAELAALFDALLQQPGRRNRLESVLVTPVARELNERRRHRAARAGATRVEFFTLVRGDD